MLSVIIYIEYDCDLRIERLHPERTEVSIDVEYETVDPGRQRLVHEKEWLNSPILIGPCVA